MDSFWCSIVFRPSAAPNLRPAPQSAYYRKHAQFQVFLPPLDPRPAPNASQPNASQLPARRFRPPRATRQRLRPARREPRHAGDVEVSAVDGDRRGLNDTRARDMLAIGHNRRESRPGLHHQAGAWRGVVGDEVVG